jgi:hypothetical protein
MPTYAHESQTAFKPTAADNRAEREAHIDEIVARMRRIEFDARKNVINAPAPLV